MSKKKSPHPEDNVPETSAETEAQTPEVAVAEGVAEPVSEDQTADAGATDTDQTIAELREEADRLMQEVAEVNDKYLRVAAELENARRRAQTDLSEARKFAIKDFAEEVINVRDSLELAQGWEPGEDEADGISLKEGLETTLKQLDQTLEKFAIKEVAPEPGDKLDPNLHQAMTTQESKEVAPNHVLSVIRKGYTIHERLLRPAMVVVARADEDPDELQTGTARTEEQPEDA